MVQEMHNRKAIILAGGLGTRLAPLTLAVSKQLLPIYNRPMIYYPMSLVMQSDIRDVLLISDSYSLPMYWKLFKDGRQFGLNIEYAEQKVPNGLAQAFVIGKQFIGKSNVALFLGDNIFWGAGLAQSLLAASKSKSPTIFAYKVKDPRAYGVVEFDAKGNAISLEEKPKEPRSEYAVPGIYFYPNSVVEIAESLKPSARGEYEITDVNKEYLARKELKVEIMPEGTAWLDSGTFTALNDASNFVRTIQERTGMQIADLEQIAKDKKWI